MAMNQTQILQALYELQDLKYQKFHSGLVPGKKKIIGVRMPDLRALSKTIAKGGAEVFLDTCPHEWYEQSMLYGMVLAFSGLSTDSIQQRLDIFLPHIDNWAVCDCTANGLRVIAANKETFLDWIMHHLSDPEPFTKRFMICLLMDYYLDESHIDRVLEIFTGIRSEDYYVNMGLAWALCECLIKHYDKALPIIEKKTLSPWVQNKTIQKSTESYRLTREQKQTLRSLKMKKA